MPSVWIASLLRAWRVITSLPSCTPRTWKKPNSCWRTPVILDGGFSLDYIWLSGLDVDRQIGEMWQADLKQLGIDLKIQEMPLNTWWEAQGNPETAPQMMMGQWGLDYADATSQIWVMYYSGNFPPTRLQLFLL